MTSLPRFTVTMTRRLAALGLPLVLAFGLGTAQAQTKITVGYVPIPDLMPLYIAKEQGFFDKRGLDVTLQTIPINPNIPPALQSDSIQIGTVTPSVLMQAADSGLALKVVAGGSVLTADGKTPSILVRKGVEIKSPQDFVGKRVGVAGFGATLHVLFRKWLSDKGVDAKKVNFVEVALPQTLDVMRGGSIDATVPAEPFGTRIVQAGVATPYAYVSDDFPAAGVRPSSMAAPPPGCRRTPPPPSPSARRSTKPSPSMPRARTPRAPPWASTCACRPTCWPRCRCRAWPRR